MKKFIVRGSPMINAETVSEKIITIEVLAAVGSDAILKACEQSPNVWWFWAEEAHS